MRIILNKLEVNKKAQNQCNKNQIKIINLNFLINKKA